MANGSKPCATRGGGPRGPRGYRRAPSRSWWATRWWGWMLWPGVGQALSQRWGSPWSLKTSGRGTNIASSPSWAEPDGYTLMMGPMPWRPTWAVPAHAVRCRKTGRHLAGGGCRWCGHGGGLGHHLAAGCCRRPRPSPVRWPMPRQATLHTAHGHRVSGGEAGIDLQHVPYGGRGLTDVIGGQVPWWPSTRGSAAPCQKRQAARAGLSPTAPPYSLMCPRLPVRLPRL